MLSIQEVHFYNILVEKGLVNPMNCPFNEDSVSNHIIIPNLNENDSLFFTCLTCVTNFELGLNTEQIIKNSINKYKNTIQTV
jgi:hypothetical protein